MEAAARTATRLPVDREQHAMTRHGMVQPSAAGTQPPATESTHVYGDYRRRQSRAQPPAVPTTPRGGATKRSVRIHPGASRRRSRRPRYQPKIEIPIAIARGPRVPSSGTFVRLPAPETLHESRRSGFGSYTAKAAVLVPTTLPFVRRTSSVSPDQSQPLSQRVLDVSIELECCPFSRRGNRRFLSRSRHPFP